MGVSARPAYQHIVMLARLGAPRWTLARLCCQMLSVTCAPGVWNVASESPPKERWQNCGSLAKKSTSKKWKIKGNNKSIHLQATEQPWGQNPRSGRQYLRQLWAKVRKIFCWLQSWCQIDKFKQQSFVNSHFTGSSSETKRKEESSEEEESRKEAYSKAQSMKSLFQQGQTMAAKRYKRPNNKTIS